MADAGLFAHLQLYYPNVPSMAVIKVMKRFDNDKEKCMKALDEEKKLYPDSGILGPAHEVLNSSNNNLRSPSEGKSITARIQELQVAHESGAHSKPLVAERHVSTIERALVNTRNNDPKRTVVSFTSQPGEKTANAVTAIQTNRALGGSAITPQTAPPDFAPFLFNHSPCDVPNIDCRAGKSRQVQINSPNTSSPAEQRRPVKVINIPPGSLSGGSVSPAATPPNHRQIRMHFGDTGGVCTISAPPSNMQRYGSTPNVSQHFRTEIRTETSLAQPLHSSSILLNTANLGNHSTLERANMDLPSDGRRTPIPPLNISPSFQASKPLSTPVQATSPGIAHSKPVFVEIIREPYGHGNFNDSFQSGIFSATVRPPPTYNSSGYNYSQYNSDFPNSPHHEQFNKGLGYTSPPSNIYQPGYGGYGYPGTPGGHTGQAPNHHSNFTHYTPPNVLHHIPKSPIVGMSQPLVASRSSSQESDHSAASDYENRSHGYNNIATSTSSHGNIISDVSSNKGIRSRSGSMQEDPEYIQALLLHQKSRKFKLEEDIEQHLLILEKLRREVGEMEKNMMENGSVNRSFPSIEDIAKLCESNRLLQTDIQMYMNEIDLYKSGQVPVSKINPLDQQNFFANMPTGQQDPIYNRSMAQARAGERKAAPAPPPRPPPPIPYRQPAAEVNEMFRVPPVPPALQPPAGSGDSEEGESWNCSYCTFSNHPAMKKCEVCEMPRTNPEPVPCPPIPPHQPLVPLPPRLASSQPLSHHHRAGT